MERTINDFILAPIFGDEWQMDGLTSFAGDQVSEKGDWRTFASFSMFEAQRRRIETSSCVTYAILNAIEILHMANERRTVDYSERYTSTLAGTTKRGNTPQKVLETIRKYGLVDETVLPFTDSITTWEQYYEPIAPALKSRGRRFTRRYKLTHDWIFTTDTPGREKAKRLEYALTFSPIPVSVEAWREENEVYYSEGGRDNHCALVIGYDKDYWYVLDTYAPFIKKLRKDYPFGVAKRLGLTRRRGLSSYFL